MKYLLIGGLLAISSLASAQRLEKIHETDTVFAIPESVLPIPDRNEMYVSLIDGSAWAADGKGSIGILDRDGKNYRSHWVTGLHAPKGMGLLNNKLYVADITSVVVIDTQKAAVTKVIEIDSAQNLNDVTVDKNGNVFVSDSRTGKIWKLTNDKPTLFLENMKGVNGLKAVGDELYIASGKSFVKADAQGALSKIAELPMGGDGVEPVGNGDFIVTAWAGYIFYVHANGKVDTLLETHQDKVNTADIGFDPVNRIIYVPTFNAKKIILYKLVMP